MALTYKSAGVNKHEGYNEVNLIKKFIKNTYTEGVLSDLGGFSGLFELGKDFKNPVLVSGTDGVGTKVKLAQMMDVHNTVGIDCVAMCVNDILCQGAKPLFFLDYIATGKLVAEKMASIVEGVAEGCIQSGSALIGGETAEMPGIYKEEDYDIAGFCVGVVEKDKIIDGKKNVKKGNVIPQKEIFSLLQKWGEISKEEMYGTFNMGIGMLIFVEREDVEGIKDLFKEMNEEIYEVGEVVEGNSKVILC